MLRIPETPPIIPPIEDNNPRPLWSVMIPVYNCSKYLPEALRSVLQQALSPQEMQIEVVDDCSTDANVEEIVKEIGRGRVTYYRQPENVGSLRNFETCIKRSRGQYVHLLHGDDCVKEGFYKRIAELFEAFPDASAAFTSYEHIKEDNTRFGPTKKESDTPCILNDWLYRVAEKSRLQYACMVVKRNVYEKLGSFYIAHYGEDWEMWVRIARHFQVAYTPETLAEYRLHSNSITAQSFLSGKNFNDISRVIDKISLHLPDSKQRIYNRRAKKHYAHYALRAALSLWFKTQNKQAVKLQIEGALNLHKDIGTITKAMWYQFLMGFPRPLLSVFSRINQKMNLVL